MPLHSVACTNATMTVQSSILPPPLAKKRAHAKPCSQEVTLQGVRWYGFCAYLCAVRAIVCASVLASWSENTLDVCASSAALATVSGDGGASADGTLNDRYCLACISPQICAISSSNMLSYRPSVASTTTSPGCTSSTVTSAESASSGDSMMEGCDSWNGMLNMCCCAADAKMIWPLRTMRTPESPRLATSSLPPGFITARHTVEEPGMTVELCA
mmetsp:Transcript_37577/g.94869  ORF Transcript_37577/g.94869 Transcript_37577/m.94869 type:complete len:215 (+) Transcript_37577:1388-2032(+)